MRQTPFIRAYLSMTELGIDLKSRLPSTVLNHSSETFITKYACIPPIIFDAVAGYFLTIPV